MPLDKPSLQPFLFVIDDLVEDYETPEVARMREEQAANVLMQRLTGLDSPPEWADRYLMLRNQGWTFRKAAYIAWKSMPKEHRLPRTQQELAVEVLGLSSDRVITTWRERNPMIDEAVNALMTADLYSHRSAVFGALKASASNPDYKHHPDRKLFLEMTGDYIPISQLRAMLMSGKLKSKRNLEDLSEDELIALAAGDWSVLGDDQDEEGESEEE